MHDDYNLMSQNVVGKLHHKHGHVGPSPVVALSVKGIVPRGRRRGIIGAPSGATQN